MLKYVLIVINGRLGLMFMTDLWGCKIFASKIQIKLINKMPMDKKNYLLFLCFFITLKNLSRSIKPSRFTSASFNIDYTSLSGTLSPATELMTVLSSYALIFPLPSRSNRRN